ncbi:FAD-dependent oxidoreductase [Novipirellula maiorica]|nr:FAD-dependent oxidoreductase [Rhodopirellula maiorica]
MNANAIHHSCWVQSNPLAQRFDRLSSTHTSDVAVVGGGITGLSVALELLHRGFSVAVYEASIIGGGTTGGSTGHLDAHPEIGCGELLSKLGETGGREYVQLRQAAIAAIEHRAANDCDVTRVPGYYYSEHADDASSLRDECEAAARLGLPVEWCDKPPLPYASVGFRIDSMARMDSMAYLRRLTDLVVEAGGKIFEKSIARVSLEEQTRELPIGDGTAHFDHLVLAAHCNKSDSMLLDIETPAYQSYALLAVVTNPPEDGLFWDNSDPYFYIRRWGSASANKIIVGGCDHRTGDGDTQQAQADLEEYVRQRFDVRSIESRWSAELFEPTDGLPMIGNVPGKKNVWIATGLSGVGLTLGTAAGWLIADQIFRGSSTLQDALSPARLSVSAITGAVTEMAAPVKGMAQRILPAKRIDPATLRPGEGAVGDVEGVHTAICRDKSGTLHQCDPVCTHMGGTVSWNEAEQTWDCPVHGGRFTNCGKRLYGPPEQDLQSPKADKQ